jgi:hypothetical protein
MLAKLKFPRPEKKKQETQFKPGDEGGPGRGKTVNPESGSPLKRDAKAMHANSTAGKAAEATGASRHKAEEVLSLFNKAEAGDTDRFERFARPGSTLGLLFSPTCFLRLAAPLPAQRPRTSNPCHR